MPINHFCNEGPYSCGRKIVARDRSAREGIFESEDRAIVIFVRMKDEPAGYPPGIVLALTTTNPGGNSLWLPNPIGKNESPSQGQARSAEG